MLNKVSFLLFSTLFYSFIFALPPFFVGIWIDAELITITITAITSLLALSEAILFYKREHFLNPVQQILFMYFLSFILLGVAVAPWVYSFELHYFGLPQADGLIFYISFLVMYLACCALMNNAYEKAVRAVVIMAVFLIIGFVVLNHQNYHISLNPKWSIYVFSAFIAFIGLCVVSMRLSETVEFWCRSLMLFGIGIIAISFNKTAILGLLIASCVFPVHLYKNYMGRFWGYFVVSLAPFAFIIATITLAKNYPVTFESLDCRYKQLLVVFWEFYDHPLRLLSGFGFGHFIDGLLHQLIAVGSGFYENGIWKPTWGGIDRIDFNAQHYIVDALLSCGILGGMWAFGLPLFLLWLAPKHCFNLVVFICFIWICIASTWFMLYLHLPFMALLCAFIATSSDRPLRISHHSRIIIVVLITSFVGLSYASYHLYQTAKLFTLMDSWLAKRIKKNRSLSFSNLIKYGASENSHLATYIQSTLDYLSSQPFDEKVQDELKVLLTASLHAKKPSALLRIVTLNVFDYLINVRGEYLLEKNWERYLNETILHLPKRFDLTAQYIAYLIYKNRQGEAQKWLNKIEIIHPDNPVTKWFRGIMMVEVKETKGQGIMTLRRAIEEGAGKLVPIDSYLLDLIYLPGNLACIALEDDFKGPK